jgi:biofilm PGA synthesis protein PgaD
MKADSLIIQRPERQKPLQRITFTLITIAAWTFWVSLWLPVITFFAWLLGLGDAYKQLNTVHAMRDAGALAILPGIGCICALIFIAWSFYNRVRFRNNRRRHGHQPLDAVHMARKIGARAETAVAMRANRRSVVRFSDGGRMYLSASRALGTINVAGRLPHHPPG